MLTRRNILMMTAICLSLPDIGAAMFAAMSFEDLVKSSDVVVTGTYQGTRKDGDRTVGVLSVDTVHRGEAGREILLAVPQPNAPISSSDVVFRKGQSGLWFLRSVATGLMAADHPQRFVPAAEAADALKQLDALR